MATLWKKVRGLLVTVAAGAMVLASGSCDVNLDGFSVFVAPDAYCCDDGYFEFGGSYYEDYYYEEGYYEEGYVDDGYYFP